MKQLSKLVTQIFSTSCINAYSVHVVKLLPPRGGGPSSFCLQTMNKVLMNDHERPGNVQLIFNQQGKNDGEINVRKTIVGEKK